MQTIQTRRPPQFVVRAAIISGSIGLVLYLLFLAGEVVGTRVPSALIWAGIAFGGYAVHAYSAYSAAVQGAIESEPTGWLDYFSLYLGRVTMCLVAIIVIVMFTEVILRYAFEKPTLWANELSLWTAAFVFLLSGLYAMQQRSHIRIFLLYDLFPRWLQRFCDLFSTALIVIFAAAMVWGGFNEAYAKLMRWETFGTAFDPPIPATLKPAILIVICIVALQAISNLIMDWSKEKVLHSPADDLDEIPADAVTYDVRSPR